jgi:hypothetical protein
MREKDRFQNLLAELCESSIVADDEQKAQDARGWNNVT